VSRNLRRIALLAALVAGCSGVSGGAPSAGEGAADARFTRAAEGFLGAYLDANPSFAVSLGYHDHDGKLDDVSAAGLAREIDRLRAALATFEAFDPRELSTLHQLERETLLLAIRGDLCTLTELRAPWRNPMHYNGALELDRYLAREYAPLGQRARAIVALARGAPARLAAARANLEERLAAPWLTIAIFEVEGQLEFLRADVREALAPLTDPRLRADVDDALATLARALEDHRAFLVARQEHSDQSHVLGAAALERVVEAYQAVDVDVDELERLGRDAVARDTERLALAARAIDPERPAADVVREVLAVKPLDVLVEARRQSAEARRFILERDLMRLPGKAVAEVRETPPYARTASAMLDGAGPFEPETMPSFYLISPPDSRLPPAEQAAYVPSTWDLMVITTHELYPGHFVDELHRRTIPSRVLKSFWHQLVGEGWAHYTEQLMWEEGFARRDPRFHVAQLFESLIRDQRLLCAIGIHARGMTVDECAAAMREVAYQDAANARDEAVRGTYDPTYLSYTLGKQLILELREEVREREGERFRLRDFHDRFLALGGAPFPAIRRAMLGLPPGVTPAR
jgi:uncharacterized protein (DUF885 family)